MTRLVRWDTGDTICEHDGDIRATVEAAAKLGISCFRASLDGARLDGASLDRARLVGASLDRARLDGASLVGASLVGARLVGASLVGASLPICCKWSVTYVEHSVLGLLVAIGCKSKSIQAWDNWFRAEETEEFDTPRDSDEFARIRANYQAILAYLVALGKHVVEVAP